MIIRKMRKEDLTQVAAIEAATFSEPWSAKGFEDTLQMTNVLFLVAEQEHVICGYCGIYFALDEGEITNVAVDRTYRRQGVGSQLVGAMLAQAQKQGIKNYILEVRVSNQNAIALYKKHGFQIEGTRKNFYRMPIEDAYIMCVHQ